MLHSKWVGRAQTRAVIYSKGECVRPSLHSSAPLLAPIAAKHATSQLTLAGAVPTLKKTCAHRISGDCSTAVYVY